MSSLFGHSRRALVTATAAALAAAPVAIAKKKRKPKKKCPKVPQPFCAGAGRCDDAVSCQAAGSSCFWWVRVDNGQPFCGQTINLVANCAECDDDHVCIRTGGPDCPTAALGCSSGCPNPR